MYKQIVDAISPWLLDHGAKIALIITASLLVIRFGRIFLEKLVAQALKTRKFINPRLEEQRQKTLIRIASGSLNVIVLAIMILMLLSEVGVNIGPLLAAAGVAGLAFGFGGQYLIKDIITGLFLIVENQYRVGDVVCFDGTCGLVEDISLRMTTLRDLDGTVHHVPHGEIKKVSNLSKNFSRVNLDIGVAYSSDLEKVIEVINSVGREMSADPKWQNDILSPPQFLRVDNFADSAIIVKILGDTKPLKQWDVAGELRKRLKVAFDRHGITIPFPQMDIHKI